MARPMDAEREGFLRRLADEIRVWREEATREAYAVDDLTLAAYVAGELEEAKQRWVEERLADSPDLAEIARVVRETLQQGDWRNQDAEAVAEAQMPFVLAPQPAVLPAESAIGPPSRSRPARRIPRWAAAAAIAAAVLLGIAAGAVTLGPWLRNAFRVSTELLGGNDNATLNSGITNSAAGKVNKSMADLKDSGSK